MRAHRKNSTAFIPTPEQVRKERRRLRWKKQFWKTLRSTVSGLIVVAAFAILIVTLFLPVLQVSGTSMEPTLEDKDVILLAKTKNFTTGDLIGLRYEGKVLLKRVIGGPGDWIDIDEEGNVYVNRVLIDEPYVTDKSLGDADVKFPLQVADECYFVLGDHRSVSIDSRSSVVGCIRYDQIIGRVIFRIYPLNSIVWIQ